jgi:hypothetical protein
MAGGVGASLCSKGTSFAWNFCPKTIGVAHKTKTKDRTRIIVVFFNIFLSS